MAREIVIAVKKEGEPWERLVVEDNLKVYQGIVEGNIECCYRTVSNMLIFGNEEGRIRGMKPNVATPEGTIVGPVFAVRSGTGGEFDSLTKKDLKMLGVNVSS